MSFLNWSLNFGFVILRCFSFICYGVMLLSSCVSFFLLLDILSMFSSIELNGLLIH